jgi:DNA-binding response OmpR family regulator
MKSILLVDDEAFICAGLQQTLQSFDFHVEVAHTLESAQRKMQRARFDLVLTEFNLKSERRSHPRAGNGLKLVQRLRTLQITTPVLLLTCMKGEPYEISSLDAGADDFIPITITIPSLIARLRAHIRRGDRERARGAASVAKSGVGRAHSRNE